MSVDHALIEDVRSRLAAEGDAARAAEQQRYMKSSMPYLGVTLPRTTAIAKAVFAEHPLASYDDWSDTVLALFREATHRELWYVAEQLAEWRAYRIHARRLDSLKVYEAIITEGAWWDIVDGVAAHLVGGLFETDAAWTAARMREWSTDGHLWKRRTSIICQLRRKELTDLPLLYDCIGPNLADRDFFVRKAIGWALRELSKTRPDEVARYVEEHREALSPLSKREALKRLLKDGVVAAIP
ncbi:MAG: DNA alkylation repair protein [Dehalococcoidia bacterium]